MPLSELEKAGLETITAVEVNKVLEGITSKMEYVKNLNSGETKSHYMEHLCQLNYLQGKAQGIRIILELLNKHL